MCFVNKGFLGQKIRLTDINRIFLTVIIRIFRYKKLSLCFRIKQTGRNSKMRSETVGLGGPASYKENMLIFEDTWNQVRLVK